MKRFWRMLQVLAAVAVLAIAALLYSLVRSVPPLSGHERVAGLGARVDVSFDSLAIPRIAASSDADAMEALGYLHARERLWAMDLLRRSAEGRLSAMLGEDALASDEYLRSLDIVRAARRGLATMPAANRRLLDAYVRGINAWIAAPTRPLPPEFRLLRYKPEPWSALQSFEVARLMAWDLQAGNTEQALAAAERELGPVRVRELFPPTDSTMPTIIRHGEGTWGVDARTRGRAARPVALRQAEIPAVPALAEALLDWAAMSRASNSWVVAGSRTASGKPILANDPHLSLRAPSLWYLATIASPHFAVSGATIPGLPGVILGHNHRIAWGWTNLSADDVDFVEERLNRDETRVLTVDGWKDVEVEHDSIQVGDGKFVPFTLRRTSHGPLLERPGARAQPDSLGEIRELALRWNAHDPSDEASAVLDLDRAGNWNEFLAAARQLKAPEQNWIYADVDGNIGYTATGNIPVRRSGTGLLPTPGWTDEGRWERYLDFDELPRVFNPREGFIVTANNRVIGPEYPDFITADWDIGYRAARIRELITGHHAPITARDVESMQMDTVDIFARWAKEPAAQAAEAAGHPDAARALRAWDGTMGSDRTEPVIFWLWYRELQRSVFADAVGETSYTPGALLQSWLRTGASPWRNDPRSAEREDLAAFSRRAMAYALGEARGRRWGAIHSTVSQHPLGRVAPLEMLLRLNIGPAPRAGSLYTVDVADFGSRPPFVNTHAASFRQVVDLAKPDEAGMIVTTGESGNPLSRHYRDQKVPWWKGRLARVSLSREPGIVLELEP